MESNLNDVEQATNSQIQEIGVNTADGNGKSPITVATLYYSCDSNIFQSSESSVKVVSANNYNATIGHRRPNFCELDIITKKENLKLNVDFVPLQTISEELKSLPMSKKLKNSKTGFRKKIYHKSVEGEEEPSEILCLASILKDDTSEYQPPLRKRSKEACPFISTKDPLNESSYVNQERKAEQESQKKKKKNRSKSRRSKPESDTNQANLQEAQPKKNKELDEFGQQTQSLDIFQIPLTTPQFVDLGMAKTMYYAELPNSLPSAEGNLEHKRVEYIQAPKPKTKKSDDKKKKKKQKKSKSQNKETKLGKQDLNPKEIIINRVENEYPPPSSPGSLTTLLSQAYKKDSDISFTSLEPRKSLKTEFRQRHNSPNTEESFLDDVLRKYKTGTTVHGGNYRKKHRTSPKSSTDNAKEKCRNDAIDAIQQPETELRVIYKIDQNKPDTDEKEKKKDKKRKAHSRNKKGPDHRSRSTKSPKNRDSRDLHRRSKSNMKDDRQVEKTPPEVRKEKSKRHIVDQEIKTNEQESILDIYQKNEPLRSESCTMIAVEEYLKDAERKKPHKSRKSKSRSSSPNKKATKKTDSDKHKVHAEDLPFLEDTKDRKNKQRSKSRITEEKSSKKRCKSKAAKTPAEDHSQDLSKRISRRSTSDISKKGPENFDGHKSIEGVQKDRNTSEEKHCRSISSKNHKSTNKEEVVTTIEEVKDTDKFSYKLPEQTVLSVSKEKRKRSKSYTPKKEKLEAPIKRPAISSRSHIFDTSQHPSATHFTKRQCRKVKALAGVEQTHKVVNLKHQPSPKEKLYEELQKISNIQQIEETRKRFRVVSRTVHSKLSDGSTTQSTEQSYLNKNLSGSRRFKTYICSEKEKEAILNLPIFNKDINQATTIKGENFEEYTVEIEEKRSTRNVKHSHKSGEIEERSKKKKKIRRTVSRKEVTFSHLNIAPVMDLYRKPSRNMFVRKALLPERKPSEFRKINKFITFKDQLSHLEVSEDTDLSSNKVDPLMKLSIFTIILGEKILEICTKTIDEDGKIMEGFTVSGTEPPKRFKIHDPGKDRLKMMARVSKLHCTYHSPIEIIDGVMKIEPKPQIVKEDPLTSSPPTPPPVVVVEKDPVQVTKAVSAVVMMTDDKEEFDVNEVESKELKDELIQVTYRDNPPSKTPVLLKTKRKFTFTTKRKSSGKLNMKKDPSAVRLILALRNAQTSTESHSNSDSVIECQSVNSPENSEVILRQTKIAQKQDNSSRISSAVKLMESSLQIIKEESQSTDSSRVSYRVNSVKEVKHSPSEIKETQTDLDVRDIDKIKEVITFLYRSIDAKNSVRESMATITASDKVFTKKSDICVSKEDSSTENSSYQEQFKNFVRNVTPKFSGLKKNSKQEIHSKASVCNVNRPRSPIPSRIPMLSQRPSIPQVPPIKGLEYATSKISDTLSSSEPSSISSTPKDAKTDKPPKNQKNCVRQRSNSADVLTSGYFEKYRTTKALIEQQRKKRAESADGTMRKVTSPTEPEFKSSTSMSDFSSIVFSFKDDSMSIKSKETDVVIKGSDEKYVQCVLVADIVKELIDKNIGTVTEDEKELGSKKPSPKQSKSLIAKVKSTLSFEKNDSNRSEVRDAVPDKILSDKSLQTSVVKEEIKQKEYDNDRKISVLYADVPCHPSTKRRILDEILNRMSSHSFVTPRKLRPKVDKEKPQLKREPRRSELSTFEKMNKFEKIRRVFAGRHENLLRSSLFNCQFSEKRRKPYNHKGPEADYINLMKLERHLEQVLGLYPFIFKAIRSQIDDSTMRKLDKKLKIENPELFTSYDTLATTIDTVSDNFERYPSFSESNINRFNRYCESLNLPGQEYQLQQFIESQNILRQCIKEQFSEKKITHENRENRFSRNKEKSHRIKEKDAPVYAPTDTTSTSSKNNKNNFRPKFAKTTFKSKMKKKKSPLCKKNGSVLSYISQNPDFCSSSSSNVDDWSIGSPLYSITTPSLNISFLGRSQSSTSVIKNKPTPVKLTKSNSVMEMSSIQKVNRRLALSQLVEANNIVRTHDNKQNVLVVSVNSSCTVFATPSKFLAKVEKQLQKSDDTKNQEHNHNPANNSNTNSNTNNMLRQKTSKKQIDEQSFHSLFFSDSNMKSPARSEPASHKPFFFHKTNPIDTNDKLPDPLDVSPTSIAKNTVVAGDEEDLGNFSADSLESNESKQQELGRYQQEDPYQDNSRQEFEEYRGDNLYEEKGPQGMLPQSFFVYSSTVNYSRNVSKSENKAESRQQSNTQNIQHIPPAHAVQTSTGGFINGVEDTSKTMLSESGYESTKSKRTASIRNFFKKGGSLLDIFRNSSKNKIAKGDNRTTTNFSNIWMKKTEKVIEINQLSGGSVKITEDNCNSRENSPCRSDNTVYWSTIKHISPRKERTTTFGEIASSSRSSPRERSQSPKRSRGTNMPVNNKSCSCSEPSSAYQRQMDECHAYAEKVLLESQMRREGYYKQYQDFKEIPLELLIGKRIPNKYKYSQEVSVMTKPKSKTTSTQSRRHAKGKGVDATSPAVCMQNIAVAANLKESRQDIVVLRSDSPMKLDISVEKKSRHTSPARPTKEDVQTSLSHVNDDSQPLRSDVVVFRGESRVRLSDTRPPVQIHKPPLPVASILSRPSLKPEDRTLGKVKIQESSSFHDFWRFSKKDKDTSTDRKEKKAEKVKKKDELPLITKFCKDMSKRARSKSREKKVERGCICDGSSKLPPEKPHQKLRSPPPEVKVPITLSMDVKDIEEDFKPKDMSPSLIMPLPDLDEKSAESDLIDMEPVPVEKKPSPESLSSSTTSSLEIRESTSNDFYIQLLLNDIVDQAMHISEKNVPLSDVNHPPLSKREKHEQDRPYSEQKEPNEEPEICRRSSEDFRKGLTDKEVFDKLLNSFEKEDEIATRLSKDEEFFKDQIKTIKKESDDSINDEKTGEPNEIIYSEDFGGRHRSTHFWEEKMKAMRAEEENPVKEDDIGTCFSRGFRPDNIALSGDACFSLNKQDRIKFSKGMLTNEESIIDFSERETPLDFLLALGFMVDEASNALKDEDIRSRLLAAITEARVWINKITTTQGTLLYLVAYKSRPKTMRYFLQLVEAIINKRINNAIKLDGFLRVLEKVEEGEIQMINILGADKFEDEENEEKIVKKQLRQLFITVYKIAEKEAMMKGKQLSQQAIVLLRILAAKYRAGLHPHLELIARYIGQDLLNTETQLEAAMIFLSRLDTAEVKLKEFEAYCDIKCEKNKNKTALNKTETILERSTSLPERAISVTEGDALAREHLGPREINEINSRNKEELERRDKQDKQQKPKKRDDSRDRDLGTKKKSNLAAKGKSKH